MLGKFLNIIILAYRPDFSHILSVKENHISRVHTRLHGIVLILPRICFSIFLPNHLCSIELKTRYKVNPSKKGNKSGAEAYKKKL